jgi:hypothetical protein
MPILLSYLCAVHPQLPNAVLKICMLSMSMMCGGSEIHPWFLTIMTPSIVPRASYMTCGMLANLKFSYCICIKLGCGRFTMLKVGHETSSMLQWRCCNNWLLDLPVFWDYQCFCIAYYKGHMHCHKYTDWDSWNISWNRQYNTLCALMPSNFCTLSILVWYVSSG